MEWITRYGAPHLTWMVAALLVQRERQRWHHGVARRYYQEAAEDEGAVVEHPGWRYERHGIGVCLRGPDGERLDVDFDDEDGAIIDTWFFASRVESLKAQTFVERRLWRWRPNADVIVAGFDELAELGAIQFGTYRNKATLAPALEARVAEVARDLARDGAEARWMAALEPRGEAVHAAEYRAWLRQRVRTVERPGRLLDLALDGASPDEVLALCRPIMRRKGWDAGHLIELLRGRPEVPAVAEVADALRAALLADDHPFMPMQACSYPAHCDSLDLVE